MTFPEPSNFLGGILKRFNIQNINHIPCKSHHTTHYMVLEFLLTAAAIFELTANALYVNYKSPSKNTPGLINVVFLCLCLFHITVVWFLSPEKDQCMFSQFLPLVFLNTLQIGTLGSCSADPPCDPQLWKSMKAPSSNH